MLLTFGIGQSDEDDTYLQISRTSEALHSAKILNRVRFTDDLEEWTHRTLMAYSADGGVAVILRGVICAMDLARLVIHAVENDADLTCAVDIAFSPKHLMITNLANIDRVIGEPIAIEDILRSPKFIPIGCCDASVKVYTFGPSRWGEISDVLCSLPETCSKEEQSTVTWDRLRQACPRARIMISPSVKSSPDPINFRSAIQLGFMDIQGFDYQPIEWEDE